MIAPPVMNNGHRVEEVFLDDEIGSGGARVDGVWQSASDNYYWSPRKPGRRVWRFDTTPAASRMKEALIALRKAGLPIKGVRVVERWTKVGGVDVFSAFVQADGFPPETE